MQEVNLSNANQFYLNNKAIKNQAKVQNNNVTKPKFNTGAPKQDVLVSSTADKYSADDGKISTGDKLKSFAKGLISPVTTMFSSPKNLLIGAGMIIATGALTIATGGAIAPVLVAAGVVGGGIQLGKSTYKAATAKTDDEARAAWQGLGTGTMVVAGSVAGAKGALKSAGINTEGMNCIQATAKCVTSVPSQVGKAATTFTSGEALSNLKAFGGKKKSIEAEAKQRTQDELKAKEKAEATQKYYDDKYDFDGKNAKSAKESAEVFENHYNEIEQEAKLRTEQEISQKRNAELYQANEKAKIEKKLSNKSAKDSAKVFEKAGKTDTQLKLDEVTENTIKTNEQPVLQAKETPKAATKTSKSDTKTIIQNDGTEIKLKYDENGLIEQSSIKKPNGQRVLKSYKNGRCTDMVELNKWKTVTKTQGFEYGTDGKNAKSAKESAEVFENHYNEIEQEAKLRTEQEISQKRNAELYQANEKAKIEKKLSNKSAKDSAKVFEKAGKTDTQLKLDEVTENTIKTNEQPVSQAKETAKVATKTSKSGTKTIIQNDGTKVKLRYGRESLFKRLTIKKSLIKNTDGSKIIKTYKNGRCTCSVEFDKENIIQKTQFFKYRADGKISKIIDGDFCVKNFNYDKNGKYNNCTSAEITSQKEMSKLLEILDDVFPVRMRL